MPIGVNIITVAWIAKRRAYWFRIVCALYVHIEHKLSPRCGWTTDKTRPTAFVSMQLRSQSVLLRASDSAYVTQSIASVFDTKPGMLFEAKGDRPSHYTEDDVILYPPKAQHHTHMRPYEKKTATHHNIYDEYLQHYIST